MQYFKYFIFSLIIFVYSNSYAKTVYVSNIGNDLNDGSVNSPYLTFDKAVSVMSPGDVCIIREGIYEQQLNVSKNGSANNFLTFKAADGENVEIKGTTSINGWQLHSGNIYKTTVSMEIASRYRAIYHNGNYMDLARWPNNIDNNRWTVDCTAVTGGDNSHFLLSNIPNINWEGGLVYYLAAHSGTSWTREITSNTTDRINYTSVDDTKWPFETHNPAVWRKYSGNNRGQLYLFNKLDALDYAREWYYDDSTNTLYFQTEDGNIPANDSVEYATKQYAVKISGDYIKLEGLNVFGGAILLENNADNNQILNCSVSHGVEGYDDLTNTTAQDNASAIEVYGDNTIIKGCTIEHSALNGITVHAWAAHNPTIEGNTISNIDYIGIHASPIRTSSNNAKILKNTISNTGRDGIYVAGNNCEVAYNDVSNSQKINADSGVFYTVGNNSDKNTEIHHNWFHDATAPSYSHKLSDPAKAAGIYLDNNSKGYLVHHNVVWNVSWTGYQVNWNNERLNFYHNTIWNAWGAMDSWVNEYSQSENKIYNNYASSGSWHLGNGSNEFDIKDSPIFSSSPFEDVNNQNFMPVDGSSLVNAAPSISNFDKFIIGNSADIGAYEREGVNWTAGVNAIEDTPSSGQIIWNGNTNNDWSNATNWTPTTLPKTGTDVIIPSGLTNYPTISNSVNINSVTMSSGSSLIANSTFNGILTYNRTLVTENWYLVSSPASGEAYDDAFVNDNNLAINGTNNAIASYNLSEDNWTFMQSGTVDTFNNGQGYSVKKSVGQGSGDISFSGNLNTSNIIKTLSGGGIGNFNLLGNPYTSYINTVPLITANSAKLSSNDLWVWNQLTANYEVKNLTSNFMLSPGQGFFVSALNNYISHPGTGFDSYEVNTNSNFTFAQSNQQHNTTDTFLKTSRFEIELSALEGDKERFAKIYYINGATKGFDNGYDGQVFGGQSSSFDIFTHLVSDSKGKNFQIQSLPNDNYEKMIIPVGLKVGAEKEVTFTAKINNLPSGYKVFIEDNKTGDFIRLDEDGSSYKIISTKEINEVGRFYLHTTSKALSISENLNLENVKIYKLDSNILRISGLQSQAHSLEFYDILGKIILKKVFETNGNGELNVTLPNKLISGVYFAKVSSKLGNVKKKVVIE